MYAGCDSCWWRGVGDERGSAGCGTVTAAGGTAPTCRATDRDDEMLKAPVGPVVPGSVQFKAQHRRAAETAGAVACEPAVSQQSLMPIIGQ